MDARSLETCPYSAPSLAEILGRLQRAIDDLSLRQYSNLHLWVQRLDEEVTIIIMSTLGPVLLDIGFPHNPPVFSVESGLHRP